MALRVRQIMSGLGRGEYPSEADADPELVRALRRHCYDQRDAYATEIEVACRRTPPDRSEEVQPDAGECVGQVCLGYGG